MKQTHCLQEQIDSFLDGTLPEESLHEFEAHLESCSVCETALERRVADERFWNDTKRFLSDAPTEIKTRSGNEDAIASLQRIVSPTDDPEMIGRFAGYEVRAIVGVGGMGMVLKALDVALDRYVAIKVLHPLYATHSAARKRFEREAQAAAAVLHDNVIAIYGVDTWNGTPYLVMPYIKGESLQQRIDRQAPLEVEQTIEIAMQIARGLAAAHDQGLIHRDIKPANILMPSGVSRVIVTDFGLARASDDVSLTHSGMLAGTPQYMSPEQAMGLHLDYRSDLFSLGAVMFAMLTGRPPFRAESPYGVMRKITDARQRSVMEINASAPHWLSDLIDRLLEKSPDRRFESAHDVADHLEDCLAHLRQPATVVLPKLKPQRSKISNKLVYSVSAVVLLCVAMIAALALSERLTPTGNRRHEIASPSDVPVPLDGMSLWTIDDSALTEVEAEIRQLRRDLTNPNILSTEEILP
ncbi:MAG: protein kinase [Planctomycetota bacterium]